MFKCPFCYKITILKASNLQSFTQNSILFEIIKDDQLDLYSCECGENAVSECICCEKYLCKTCVKDHNGHALLCIVSKCSEHMLEKLFYCEDDQVAECELCILSHAELKHSVVYQEGITKKYWSTFYDVAYKKEELIEIGANVPGFNQIVSKSPKSWIEKIENVMELKRLNTTENLEIQDFFTESSAITRKTLENLLTQPALPTDFYLTGYVTRGSFDLYTYNFNTHAFKSLKISRKVLRWSGITQIFNTQLFITGGKPSKDQGSVRDCFVVHMENLTITDCPNMITAHSSHVSLLHDHKVFIISGKNSANGVSTFCEMYDLEERNWVALPNNILGRTCASGAVVGNFIYVTGGCKNNTIEEFDIGNKIWRLLNLELPDIRWQHGSAVVEGRLLVYGGEASNDEPSRTSFFFNPSNETIEELQEMPIGTVWLCGWYPHLRRGNRIWIMNKELKFLSYNIDTHSWSTFKNCRSQLDFINDTD